MWCGNASPGVGGSDSCHSRTARDASSTICGQSISCV